MAGLDRLPNLSGCAVSIVALVVVHLTSPSLAAPPTRAFLTTLVVPPVEPACVSSPFGPRILPNKPMAGTFHNGIDLPAAVGSPVVAVGPGTVIRVQRHGIGGLELLVQHRGFIGIYSHLGMIAPLLAEGRRLIYGGQKIATVGRTGLTYGPHLYFGMIVDGHPVDPTRYLDVAPCGLRSSRPGDARRAPTRVLASP